MFKRIRRAAVAATAATFVLVGVYAVPAQAVVHDLVNRK